MTTAILIPHYNTPAQLLRLIEKIPQSLHANILVVDDGSHEFPLLSKSITVIHHPHQKGYGAAQKTGFKNLLQKNVSQIILLHGDDQYDFQALWSAKNHEHSVQLASRLLEPSPQPYPRWRKMGNRFLTGVANRCFGTTHTDLHTGGRIYRTTILRTIPFLHFSDNFLFDQEMLVHCLEQQIPIHEFAISPNYQSDVSSISVSGAIEYGLGCLYTIGKTKIKTTRSF